MIDYKLLDESVLHYRIDGGFNRIEVPWVVSEKIAAITMPEGVNAHIVTKNGKKKVFVGSGEQGFLYLINKGYLFPGKYQTITPCMRDDDFGPYHTKYFMKNELIWFDPYNWERDDILMDKNLEELIGCATRFFLDKVPDKNLLKMVTTDDGMDIEYNGIELGSYGIRSCPFVTWIYGTGLALPRFTRAIANG